MQTQRNPYAGQAVTTASPARLVLMMFERVIQSIQQVRDAKRRGPDGNVELNRELQRIQDIVTELQVSLDFQRGQPIAGQLASLYEYVQGRVVEANIAKDPSFLDDVEKIFVELRDGWDRGVIRGLAASQPLGQTA